MRKLFIGLLATAGLVGCSNVQKPVTLVAGGATFPAPLYQAWFSDLPEDLRVSYQATGSGSGVRQFNAGTTDFGASDKALSDSKIERPVVQIPMTGGAIVPAYNLPDCKVALTQQELVDVFLGKITNWSELGCADVRITTVFRSDGSGTTAGFTSSLSAFSDEWKTKVGAGKSVNWPVGVGSKGNSGVASTIKNRLGAIGYVNYGFVLDGTLQQAWVQNKAGNFVLADAETSAAGLSQIKLDSKLRGKDANPAGENSYPIVSLTWVLAHPEHKKNDSMKQVFNHMLSEESQSKSDGLGYVPLPESIRQLSLAAVEGLK